MIQVKAVAQEAMLGLRAKLNNRIDAHWNRDPLTKSPSGTAEDFMRLFEQAKARSYPQVDEVEAEAGFAVDRAWLDQLALHTQIVKKKSDLAYPHGRLLYALLRRYIADASPSYVTIVETGTARGFSALCMAKALEDAGVEGRIVTLDVLPHLTPIYWNCIDDLEGRKSRSDLLAPWRKLTERIVFLQGDTLHLLPKVGVSRVNFAFLDAQHLRRNVLQEFACVTPLQEAGDMIFFDDVTPAAYPGVVEAVDQIEADGAYDMRRLTLSDQRAYAWAKKR